VTTWDALQAIAFESMKVIVAAWPVIVVLALTAIAGLIVGLPLRNPQLRRKVALLLTLYAIPIVVIGIGAILRYDGPRAPQYVEPSVWRFVVLYGVVLSHLLIFIAAVIFLKGARIRAAAVALPSIWLTLCTYFIAGIAIAGVGP
jgi:hypothetical protein